MGVIAEVGMERDALIEMEEQFWIWDAGYGDEGDGDSEEMLGEDEGDS